MATEVLRPNAAGDETNLWWYDGELHETPDPDYNYTMADEETPDEMSTIVLQFAASYARDLYNLPASSIPDGAIINFIKIHFRCFKNYATAAYAKPSLKSDSTTTDGTEVALTESWVTYSQQWNTNPADGEAWEKSDINALQIGVNLKGSGVDSSAICTQVYVEVDYTIEKTSSDAGYGVEGTPVQTAALAGTESGSGAEVSSVVTDGQLKNLFATELGQGSDSLATKIEMPTKGGGMKLWT